MEWTDVRNRAILLKASIQNQAKTVVLIRHGATQLNAEDRIRGWLDVPLSVVGEQQGILLATKFEDELVTRLVSSDLRRAYDTALMIGDAVDVPPITTRALRPWNLGAFQGRPYTEVGPEVIRYSTTRPDEAVPDGESFNEFLTRYLEALQRIMDDAIPGGLSVVVTHTRNLRAAEAWVARGCRGLDFDPAVFNQPASHEIPPGGGLVLTCTGSQWVTDREAWINSDPESS